MPVVISVFFLSLITKVYYRLLWDYYLLLLKSIPTSTFFSDTLVRWVITLSSRNHLSRRLFVLKMSSYILFISYLPPFNKVAFGNLKENLWSKEVPRFISGSLPLLAS